MQRGVVNWLDSTPELLASHVAGQSRSVKSRPLTVRAGTPAKLTDHFDFMTLLQCDANMLQLSDVTHVQPPRQLHCFPRNRGQLYTRYI